MRYLLILFLPIIGSAQNYTSYFTGNPVDLNTQPYGGVCLMGGASEDDNAMIWFLEQANGGDILVLRASGADGYNDYFYTDLGVTVNSVETIVCNNAAASDETYIHQKIAQAEAIWFAGGDQWNYISYWRNTPIDSLINLAILERNIVIGGTSAGMAILGDVYFTAENGTISSTTALNNPYATTATIDSAKFIDVPYMNYVITDTHYDNPDRRGRHVVFMSKMYADYNMGMQVLGIACEEYVAVCIDTLGLARVYGGYPTYDEQAYFIRVNCEFTDVICGPNVLAPNTPLDWNCGGKTLSVYKVNGTSSGVNYFNLNTWDSGSGGTWENWQIDDGVLNTNPDMQPDCSASFNEHTIHENQVTLYPNPSEFYIILTSANMITSYFITDISGREVERNEVSQTELKIYTNSFEAGIYNLHYNVDGYWSTIKFVVK